MNRTLAASQEVRPRPRPVAAELPPDLSGSNGAIAVGLVLRALPVTLALVALVAFLDRQAHAPAGTPAAPHAQPQAVHAITDARPDSEAARRARYRQNVATGARYFVR